MGNESQCKGCGRKIFWGETGEGKKIPLDASAPVYEFNGKSNKITRTSSMVFVSHFSTCSKANDFSHGKSPKKLAEDVARTVEATGGDCGD